MTYMLMMTELNKPAWVRLEERTSKALDIAVCDIIDSKIEQTYIL